MTITDQILAACAADNPNRVEHPDRIVMHPVTYHRALCEDITGQRFDYTARREPGEPLPFLGTTVIVDPSHAETGFSFQHHCPCQMMQPLGAAPDHRRYTHNRKCTRCDDTGFVTYYTNDGTDQ